MIEMVHRFLRQKFSSGGVVVALSALALIAAAQIAGSGGAQIATLALLILAAGCVAKDASGGALQMILCRPIRRSEYLLGRYLGVLAGFGGFLLGSSALGILFARGILPLLGSPVRPIAFGELGIEVAATFLGGVASAATILLLSTFLPGYGDVLGFILLTPLAMLPDLAAKVLRAPWLEKLAQSLRDNLLPSLDWSAVLHGRDVLGEPTGRWVLAVVLYLVFALAIFSRREFAYGQD